MKRVLITGMSATGKSTAVTAMAEHGFRAVDTDTDEWSEWVRTPSGEQDWIWREERITALLDEDDPRSLFVGGCKTNQGTFRHRFDHIVLLTAPTPVILDRLATRTTNRYGRSAAERDRILGEIETVEPLLRAAADLEIDTGVHSAPAVAARLLGLVSATET
jgi:shikimate kinase